MAPQAAYKCHVIPLRERLGASYQSHGIHHSHFHYLAISYIISSGTRAAFWLMIWQGLSSLGCIGYEAIPRSYLTALHFPHTTSIVMQRTFHNRIMG